MGHGQRHSGTGRPVLRSRGFDNLTQDRSIPMTDQVISPLRRRMFEDMAIRKFAPKTQHDYVQRGTPLEAFGRRPPELVAPPVRGRHPKPFTGADAPLRRSVQLRFLTTTIALFSLQD